MGDEGRMCGWMGEVEVAGLGWDEKRWDENDLRLRCCKLEIIMGRKMEMILPNLKNLERIQPVVCYSIAPGRRVIHTIIMQFFIPVSQPEGCQTLTY